MINECDADVRHFKSIESTSRLGVLIKIFIMFSLITKELKQRKISVWSVDFRIHQRKVSHDYNLTMLFGCSQQSRATVPHFSFGSCDHLLLPLHQVGPCSLMTLCFSCGLKCRMVRMAVSVCCLPLASCSVRNLKMMFFRYSRLAPSLL